MERNALARLVSVLLLASAAVVSLGVAVERSRPQESHATATVAPGAGAPASGETATSSEDGTGETTGDGGGGGPGGEQQAAREGWTGHSESGETLLGVGTESTPLVLVAIVGSVALAVALWLSGGSFLLFGSAAVLGIVFTAFDVREAFHQAD